MPRECRNAFPGRSLVFDLEPATIGRRQKRTASRQLIEPRLGVLHVQHVEALGEVDRGEKIVRRRLPRPQRSAYSDMPSFSPVRNLLRGRHRRPHRGLTELSTTVVYIDMSTIARFPMAVPAVASAVSRASFDGDWADHAGSDHSLEQPLDP